MGSKGWSTCRSHTTKEAMMMAEPIKAARIGGEVQGRLGGSMIPPQTSPSPAIDSAAPTGSARLASGFLELGTRKAAATRPATAMGTLMRKTEPHQYWTRTK